MTVEIVTRDAWGAKPPRHYPGRSSITADVVFMSESYGRPCSSRKECCTTVRTVQEWNMAQQGKADISYNFVIAGDGRVYEGRGWHNHPDLPFIFKRCTSTLSIGFIGNFSDEDLPGKMVRAMIDLIEYGRASGLISQDLNHHSLLSKLDRPNWRIMRGDPVVVSETETDSDSSEDSELDERKAKVNISQLDIMQKTRRPKQPWLYPIEEDKTYRNERSEDSY